MPIISYSSINDVEYQTMKNGAVIYGIHATPFGDCIIGIIGNNICYLGFVNTNEDLAVKEMQDEWYLSMLHRDDSKTANLVKKIFASNTNEKFELLLKGSDFKISVWKALINIKNVILSYEEIACKVERPKAIRAVASAIARNHISYLIPCHLVVRKSGQLGGYRWGVERKKALLEAMVL